MITAADIALVARQHDIPHWLAAGLAADVVLGERIRADRLRRDRFPQREKRRHQLAILAHVIEREEREQCQ